ncbi:hypothetical protein ONJ16_26300, partial [Salmonella enterica subsp. enterica serovar Montevideo]|nr:hypothetical protein [Salmonella enterica subsp. enterica serovar Montevideo]
FYFLPGILAGAAIDIPSDMQSGDFKWLLLATALLLWVGGWLCETGKSVREVVLERGLLTEAELDDIFSVQNLMHPAYKAKRYTD